MFTALLRHLGYQPQITVLSVPVTYASMKNRDIDVFLGNWMPSMKGDRAAYLADGSVEVVRAKLTGAKYGLERNVGQRAAQGEHIGHRNVRLCDEFGSAERR